MARFASRVLVVWTALMAIGIFAAYLNIGGDCAGLVGTAFDACRADALGRGAIGLVLLAGLWLVVAAPFWFMWNRGRHPNPR